MISKHVELGGKTENSAETTSSILMMNGGPISWKSLRQDNVSLSASEAEFVAASQARQKAHVQDMEKKIMSRI